MTWILPKQLHTSVFVQDMEALTLDLKESSAILEQSVIVRSKPMQQPTWLRKWKRDSWTLHLFGRILKPFHGQSFTEKWTSSLVAFLVNPSQQQDTKEEMKIQDTCFHISEEELNLLDLPLFSLKTLKGSSVQNLDQMEMMLQERQFCYMSLDSWKDWVTTQRQEYSVRLNVVHHIKEEEYSFLVSPLKQWGTPRTGMAKASSGQIKKDGINLSAWSGKLENQVCQMHGHHSEDRGRSLGNHQGKYKLNPRWVETLMGLPIGWTMVNCVNPYVIEQMNLECLETELCLQQLPKHSEPCGQNWSTPIVFDSRQETLSSYEKRQDKVIEEGGSRFNAMLSTQVQIPLNGLLKYDET